MTITQMQYFVAVCEYKTISKSAEMLHISQPSISLAIKDLEESFGIALFNRENKRLVLTSEGRYMYRAAKNILSEVNSLEVYLSDLGRNSNSLCIAVPIFTGSFMLKLFMRGFRKEHPEITYVIRQFNSPKAFKAVEDGSCSLAVVIDDGEIPESFERKHLLSSELEFCVSSDHPLAGQSSIDLSELRGTPIILSQENSYMSKALKNEFLKSNSVPNILMYGASFSLIMEFVSSGQAAAFIIKELADTNPDLVAIPLAEKIPMNFTLIWRKDKSNNRKVRAAIDYIVRNALENQPSVR